MGNSVQSLIEGKAIQVLRTGVFGGWAWLERDIDEVFYNNTQPSRQPRLFISHKDFDMSERPATIDLLFPNIPDVPGARDQAAIALLDVLRVTDKPDPKENGLYLKVSEWLISDPEEQLQGFIDVSGEYYHYDNEGRVMAGLALLGVDHPAIQGLKHNKQSEDRSTTFILTDISTGGTTVSDKEKKGFLEKLGVKKLEDDASALKKVKEDNEKLSSKLSAAEDAKSKMEKERDDWKSKYEAEKKKVDVFEGKEQEALKASFVEVLADVEGEKNAKDEMQSIYETLLTADGEKAAAYRKTVEGKPKSDMTKNTVTTDRDIPGDEGGDDHSQIKALMKKEKIDDYSEAAEMFYSRKTNSE